VRRGVNIAIHEESGTEGQRRRRLKEADYDKEEKAPKKAVINDLNAEG